MQPWALSLPDKELCLREALAVCTPPAPEPSAKRPGSYPGGQGAGRGCREARAEATTGLLGRSSTWGGRPPEAPVTGSWAWAVAASAEAPATSPGRQRLSVPTPCSLGPRQSQTRPTPGPTPQTKPPSTALGNRGPSHLGPAPVQHAWLPAGVQGSDWKVAFQMPLTLISLTSPSEMKSQTL